MNDNNQRILKNTTYLYCRQVVMMVLSFVSTRIVLDKLGVDNYGIYNVVGGFVALFTILNNVLQSATRRFLTLSIGRGNFTEIKKTFNTSFILHIWIGVIVVVALETVGLWMLNHYLNIEHSRMFAANWVYQFSVMAVFVSITQTPYTAAVTAHEKFNVYAIMSIYDVVAKIAVLFFIIYLPFDKLIVYAALMFIVSTTSCLIYRYYCYKQFPECRGLNSDLDKPLLKEMAKFSGWDSVGNITSIANAQGITIMLNLFFNTVVNAARGLASNVTSIIAQFVTGFIQAAEPQLIKYYGQNDMVNFRNLIFNITQLTLLMLSILAVPIWLEIDFVLTLWLTTVPDYTSTFIKITIFTCFITYSNSMLLKANVAIGKVREVSLYMIPASLIHLPIVYLVLKLGWHPAAVYWVGSIPAIMRMFIDLFILCSNTDFPAIQYLLKVFGKNLVIVAIAMVIPYIIKMQMDAGWLRFIVVGFSSVLSTITFMWILGLNKTTREMVIKRIRTYKNNVNL